MTKTIKKQTFRGTVVSDKMDKTVVVEIQRFIQHPKYQKYYSINKKYKAHDENNEYKIGDVVDIISSKPISKDKTFVVVAKIK
jgi:small subunit ribosomal protein S17